MIPDKKFKQRYKTTERFMARNAIMMERDVYEEYSEDEIALQDGGVAMPGMTLALSYSEPRPCGHIVSGPNRKERRRRESEQRKLLGKGNKHLAKGLIANETSTIGEKSERH